jgi:hypothetical protein
MSRLGKSLMLMAVGSLLTLAVCGGLVLRNTGRFGGEGLSY